MTQDTPVIHASAPLRISFAGGGTDLTAYTSAPGGRVGIVVNAAIDRRVWLYIQATPAEPAQPTPTTLLLDAAATYAGYRGNYRYAVRSSAPRGSGLGGSSALVVAALAAFQQLAHPDASDNSTPGELARAAVHLERVVLGWAGGVQDQYAAAYGGFSQLVIHRNSVTRDPIVLHPRVLTDLTDSLLLVDLGISRVSSTIIEEQSTSPDFAQHLDEVYRDGLRFATFLHHASSSSTPSLDLPALGELLHTGWLHKRATSPAVSTNRIDDLYATARATGALGGKLCGAGGGGHMLLVCPPLLRAAVAFELSQHDVTPVPFTFTEQGVRTWTTQNW